MAKFRKKPVVIEAMQFRGTALQSSVDYAVKFDDWLVGLGGGRLCRYVGDQLEMPTLEGVMTASPGDWIIRGVQGELYPCKPVIFAATYEPVAATPGPVLNGG